VLYSDPIKEKEAAVIEEKEKYMELAMRILHNTSYTSTSQATKFVCEVRRPVLNGILDPNNSPEQNLPREENVQVQHTTLQIPYMPVL